MSDALPPTRAAEIARKTGETDIVLRLSLDGRGAAAIRTGVGFLDHMLHLLARHALFDLEVEARGDTHVDDHHTVEDVGIVLGQAVERALGDKRGIARYGAAAVPMDDALANVALDLSGRAYLHFDATFPSRTIGGFASELVEEFCRALAGHAKLNLHVVVPYGRNSHHVAEAIFKAVARSLRQACAIDPRQSDIPSTKGSL